MTIKIMQNRRGNTESITTTSDVEISECYIGVGLVTPSGTYRVAQRDGGIYIRLNGETIFSRQSEQQEGETDDR